MQLFKLFADCLAVIISWARWLTSISWVDSASKVNAVYVDSLPGCVAIYLLFCRSSNEKINTDKGIICCYVFCNIGIIDIHLHIYIYLFQQENTDDTAVLYCVAIVAILTRNTSIHLWIGDYVHFHMLLANKVGYHTRTQYHPVILDLHSSGYTSCIEYMLS